MQGAEREDNISPVCQNFPHEYIPEEIVCQVIIQAGDSLPGKNSGRR